MYILAIETTGPLGSVAIIDENKNVQMKTSSEEMNHLKDLMPMAEELIKELKIKKTDITAVAASVGPGSFTGIRIGVASARAIGQALNIPCIAVPTLEVFKEKNFDGNRIIVPIFNARRGQVFGAIFDPNNVTVLEAGCHMLSDMLKMLDRPYNVFFYGDGVDAYESLLDDYAIAPKADRYQRADMVARLALEKYLAGEIVDYNHLMPEYLRTPEAEQKLKDGSLARERAAKLARFKAR